MKRKLSEFTKRFEALSIDNGQKFVLLGSLAEAKVNKESRVAEVTVIKKGWSKNGFYYGDQALQDIANHLNTSEAARVFLDHNNRNNIFEPRLNEDHIATNISAAVEGDKVIASAQYFSTGPNSWVFDRIVEVVNNPNLMKSSMGPSIVGKAKVKEGTVDGRKGYIVESIPWLHSYDMVATPAAGGALNSVTESIGLGEFYHVHEGFDVAPTNETIDIAQKLKDRQNERKTLNEWWDFEGIFFSELCHIVCAYGDYEKVSIEERKKLVKPLFEEAAKVIEGLDFIPPAEEEVGEVVWNTAEGSRKPFFSKTRIKKEGDKLMSKTLAELKAEDSALYESLIAEARKDADAKDKVETWKADSEKLPVIEETLKTTKEAFDAKTKDFETLSAEKEELSKKVTAFEAAKQVARRAELVQSVYAEVGLTTEAISEAFSKVINALPFDAEKEDSFKASVKEQAEDRKALVEAKITPKKVIEGAGVIQVETKDDEKPALDTKAWAKKLKR